MIQRKSWLFLLFVLAWLTIASTPGSAEWFADFHVGPAFTKSDDVHLGGPGLSTDLNDVAFDNSVSLGGRFGHWFEAWPYLGLALDVSHFRPDVGSQTVSATVVASLDTQVTEINFDVMLRYPFFPTNQIPNGQLQPYFTVGPGIFITRLEDTTNFAPPSNQSDTDTSVGVKVGTGAAWQFHPNWALFGEYRFTHFSPEFSFNTTGIGSTKVEETDVNTHRVVFGISLRF